MKNSVIYLGIALVVFAGASNTTYDIKSGVGTSLVAGNGVVANKRFKTVLSKELILKQKKETAINASTELKSKTFFLENRTKLNAYEIAESNESIEGVALNKISKSDFELIAEDNAITENNISNDTQVLDFEVINSKLINEEVIERVVFSKKEKTADQLIAEDNTITENNISNAIQALDFEVINSKLINEEVIERANFSKKEKTADQLIAEDNAITENNISNAVQALDFEIINRNSISN